MLVWKLMRPA